MPITDGCDATPYIARPIPGEVRIPFPFDLAVEATYTRDGQVVWSNVGAPVLLSKLIADHATAEDLAEIAARLAALLLPRQAAGGP